MPQYSGQQEEECVAEFPVKIGQVQVSRASRVMEVAAVGKDGSVTLKTWKGNDPRLHDKLIVKVFRVRDE